MDFRLKDGEQVRTVRALKASATVIEAGDLVAKESETGDIIKATASSTALAWCPNGAAAGETEVDVTIGNDFTLLGTNENVFAATMKGTEVDLVIVSTVQKINDDASSTDVLKIGIDKDSGVVGATTNVAVRINKPIF